MSRTAGQSVRFVAVGAGGYGVNLLAFAALFGVGLPYGVAGVAAYFVSNALMYLGNRYVTFGLGHDGFWAAYFRYSLVGVVVAAVNVALLAAIVEVGGLDPRLGQGVSLVLITPVAFVLNRRWTFAWGQTPQRLRHETVMKVAQEPSP